MTDNGPFDARGLPDAGGLNIDHSDPVGFEPTKDQLEMIRADLDRIADGVRVHLTGGFTVTARTARTRDGPQGVVVVEFPTGDAIGPGIQITADMFESADEPGWDGPIPAEDIETMSRQIATLTVARWAEMLGFGGEHRSLPAQ